MFKTLFGIIGDVTKIAIAPVEIAADITRAVTKPVAEAAKEVTDTVKDLIDNDD